MAYYTDTQLAKAINDHGINETDAARGKPPATRYNPKKSLRPKLRTKQMEKRQAKRTKQDTYNAKDEMWAAEAKRVKANSKAKPKANSKNRTTVNKRSTKPIQMKTVNNKRGR